MNVVIARLGRARTYLMAALLTVAGCGDPPTAAPSSPVRRIAPGVISSEISVAQSLGAPGLRGTVIAAYNAFATGSVLGWSWSDDGGLTWNACLATTVGCGSDPGGVVAPAPGAANWRGDPVLASPLDGSGIVVYANLANGVGDQGGPNLVVAALSFDGGRTFGDAVVVNDDGCANGNQDQPWVTFDPAASEPTAWFVWRHQGVVDPPGSFGACVRGGVVNFISQTIEWLAPAEAVDNMVEEPFFGSGGPVITAFDGMISVAHAWNGETPACPGGASLANDNRYHVVHSTNLGVDWTSAANFAGVAPGTPSTVRDPCAGGINSGLRDFAFIRDLDGVFWAATTRRDVGILVTRSVDGVTWTNERSIDPPGGAPRRLTLAADNELRLGLSFITVDATTNLWTTYFVARSPNTAPVWMPEPIAVSAAYPVSPIGPRFLGDYNQMTALIPLFGGSGSGTFVVPWAEPLAGGVTESELRFVTVRP